MNARFRSQRGVHSPHGCAVWEKLKGKPKQKEGNKEIKVKENIYLYIHTPIYI